MATPLDIPRPKPRTRKDVRARAMAVFQRKLDKLADSTLKSSLVRLLDPMAPPPTPMSARTPRGRPSSAGSVKLADPFRPMVSMLEEKGPLLALDLCGSLIGRDGLLVLSELMYAPALQFVQVLDLAGNQLTNMGNAFDGVSALATVVASHPTLTALNLARNALYRQGGLALARALSTNTTLQHLDLSRNNLRSQGVAAVADAISPETNPKSAMTFLELSENNVSNFSAAPRGAMALAAAIKNHATLTVLNLSHNRLERAALVAFALALEDNHSLTDLHIDANGVDPQGAAALADALRCNSTLTRLSLRDNSIRSTGATALADALRDHHVMQFLDVRDNYISEAGRVAMAAAVMPGAPSVVAAVAAAAAAEAENEVSDPDTASVGSESSDEESAPPTRSARASTASTLTTPRGRATGADLAVKRLLGVHEGEGKEVEVEEVEVEASHGWDADVDLEATLLELQGESGLAVVM